MKTVERILIANEEEAKKKEIQMDKGCNYSESLTLSKLDQKLPDVKTEKF